MGRHRHRRRDGQRNQGHRRPRRLDRCRSTSWCGMLGADNAPRHGRRHCGLRYRDFLTVGLIMRGTRNASTTTGSTSTIPASRSAASRTSSRGRPTWCPTRATACYGLEYFCFEGDDTCGHGRRRSDRAAPSSRSASSAWPGPTTSSTAPSSVSPRPTRSTTTPTQLHVDTIRDELDARFTEPAPRRPQRHAQVQQPGPRDDDRAADRPQHHRRPRTAFDVWNVNEDAEYHEGGSAGDDKIEERLVPRRVA